MKYCSKCGAHLEEGAHFCSQCGHAVPAPEPEQELDTRDPNETIADEVSPVMRYEPSSDSGGPVPPSRKRERRDREAPRTPDRPEPLRGTKSYLALAIVSTIFCCLPLGIVAIVYAALANQAAGTGDAHGFQRAQASARMWLKWAVVLGIALQVIGWIVATANW